MKIVVLGGAGAMGQVAVRDLVESAGVEEVIIADLSQERAAELVRAIGSKKLSAQSIDIKNQAALKTLLSGAACAVNCTTYYFNLDVMHSCLEAGCHYVDLGGLFHMTRKQLELDAQFRQRGLTAVLGMGAAPGITNLMAVKAAEGFDTVESIDIIAASVDLSRHDHPFLPPYAVDTILDEYFLEPVIFENGQFRSVSPMSGEVVQEFPSPVGLASSFLTLHSEVATLPLFYAGKGIERVTYRLGLPTEFHEHCKFLVALGFGSKKALHIDGQDVYPRSVLSHLIAAIPAPQGDPNDCEVMRVDLTGRKDGQAISSQVECIVFSHPRWKVSCGAFDTGVPPSIAAQMLGRGKATRPGVVAPEEAFSVSEFLAELETRGILVRKVF